MTEALALEGVKYPTQHDFLLGRGGETNNHSGNILFRQFIRDCKEDYQTAPKTQKPLISQQLVSRWRNLDPPGRFLERSDDDKTWKDVGDAVACRKTSKALGERGKRSKSEDDPSSPLITHGAGGSAIASAGLSMLAGHSNNMHRGIPATLAGNKRKMDGTEAEGADIRSRAMTLLNRTAGPTRDTPANGAVASLLQRLSGGGGGMSQASETPAPFLGADISALLQQAQGPLSSSNASTALLLANAQQQQRRQALLSAVSAASAGSSAPGASASLFSSLLAQAPAPPTVAPQASLTPLADALSLAMSNRSTAGGTSSQLLDVALARHILANATPGGHHGLGNTALANFNPVAAVPSATSGAPAGYPTLASLGEALRSQQHHASLAGKPAGASNAGTGAASLGQQQHPNQLELLQLLSANQQHQLTGASSAASDPSAVLAALRRSMGN